MEPIRLASTLTWSVEPEALGRRLTVLLLKAGESRVHDERMEEETGRVFLIVRAVRRNEREPKDRISARNTHIGSRHFIALVCPSVPYGHADRGASW